ncbi:Hypothetical predicted protein [Podarcis lilfordi]|uniref:Uncharacterized protein n=1 Tax=Podarcis lilfordi TaxID=74358 RepID=A0AA35KIL0_9SAUR|nr:Hypothetical predicted protein [Podarcis lilfordi]
MIPFLAYLLPLSGPRTWLTRHQEERQGRTGGRVDSGGEGKHRRRRKRSVCARACMGGGERPFPLCLPKLGLEAVGVLPWLRSGILPTHSPPRPWQSNRGSGRRRGEAWPRRRKCLQEPQGVYLCGEKSGAGCRAPRDASFLPGDDDSFRRPVSRLLLRLSRQVSRNPLPHPGPSRACSRPSPPPRAAERGGGEKEGRAEVSPAPPSVPSSFPSPAAFGSEDGAASGSALPERGLRKAAEPPPPFGHGQQPLLDSGALASPPPAPFSAPGSPPGGVTSPASGPALAESPASARGWAGSPVRNEPEPRFWRKGLHHHPGSRRVQVALAARGVGGVLLPFF